MDDRSSTFSFETAKDHHHQSYDIDNIFHSDNVPAKKNRGLPPLPHIRRRSGHHNYDPLMSPRRSSFSDFESSSPKAAVQLPQRTRPASLKLRKHIRISSNCPPPASASGTHRKHSSSPDNANTAVRTQRSLTSLMDNHNSIGMTAERYQEALSMMLERSNRQKGIESLSMAMRL